MILWNCNNWYLVDQYGYINTTQPCKRTHTYLQLEENVAQVDESTPLHHDKQSLQLQEKIYQLHLSKNKHI